MQKGGQVDAPGEGPEDASDGGGGAMQERVTDPFGDAGQSRRPATPTPTLNESAGEFAHEPIPCFDAARRYLDLLAGYDAPHLFQPYRDANRKDPATAWMSRRVHGRLVDVWPKLVGLQSKGAAIAVTMAETRGQIRKSANMVRPRAVWIDADAGLPRTLPLLPSMTVETSPGRYHYIYLVCDLTWELWHAVEQTLIAEYGSDPNSASRTQVLRLPGTLHLKNPARPHLVNIVEEETTELIYTVSEIAAAFPPRPTPPSRRRARVRVTPASRQRANEPGADWQPDEILSALRSIDALIQESGPFTAQGDRPDDQAIVVDWSRRDWWLRAMACLHDASGGSDAGFELSCAASCGDSSKGLVGCPSKFNAADQRRVWDSLTVGGVAELHATALTIRTIYWIAQRYCGWKVGQSGRPFGQPRPEREISAEAQAVAEAGQWAVTMGLDRISAAHAAVAGQRVTKNSLTDRILKEIRRGLDASTGVTAIGSLTGTAGTLGCHHETLRSYLRKLTRWGLIIKNDGNATSMLGRSGITVALDFPDGLRQTIERPMSAASADPPISEQTGNTTPQFRDEPGRNPSRSPYSHSREDALPTLEMPSAGATLEQLRKWPKLTQTERERLVRWLGELPETIADHCSVMAEKKGLSGTLGRLIDVLEFAAGRVDRVTLHLVTEDAVRRISFQGPEKPPADLAEMTPGDCLGRFLRKLVTVLGDEQQIVDTPGYAAIKRRAEFVRGKPTTAKPAHNGYAAAKAKRDEPWRG